MQCAGKSHEELERLEHDITRRLETGDAGDPEFWGAVLARLAPQKARVRLRDLHATLLAQHVAAIDAGIDVPRAMGWGAEQVGPCFLHVKWVSTFCGPSAAAAASCDLSSFHFSS